jgi:hypothetical protein
MARINRLYRLDGKVQTGEMLSAGEQGIDKGFQCLGICADPVLIGVAKFQPAFVSNFSAIYSGSKIPGSGA